MNRRQLSIGIMFSLSSAASTQKAYWPEHTLCFIYFNLFYLFITFLGRLIHAQTDVQLIHTIWRAWHHWPSHWHLSHDTTCPTLGYLEGITEVIWRVFPEVILVCHMIHMALSMQNITTLHWCFQSKCLPLSYITCRYSDLKCPVAFTHLFPWIALSHCMQLLPKCFSIRQNTMHVS